MRNLILAAVGGACALTWSTAAAAQPAEIRVTLPADATLTVNGIPTRSTSATRWFVSPPLADGKEYHYNFVARFVRDDRTVTVEQRVPVRAGWETVATLNGPGQSSASVANRSFYYAPPARASRAAPAVGASFYFSPPTSAPPAFGGIINPATPWIGHEWEPGNYQLYNP